jgi:hypothetical protein
MRSGTPAEASRDVATRRSYPGGSAGVIWAPVFLFLVPTTAYYTWLICLNYGDFLNVPYQGTSLFRPVFYGRALNSMLLHLLHGTFDVDPRTIGPEGFVRNGLTYAYFGIALALFRAPFLAFRDFATTDYTRFSCLVAVSAMGAFNLASLLTVWRAVGRPERRPLLVILALVLLFGGAQIQFLMASLWQEATLWGAALAAAFVYLVVGGYYSRRGFTAGRLAGLAAVAGLCLLTRVSTALGLYVALGLLMLQLLWQEWRDGRPLRLLGAIILGPVIPAGLILLGFVAIAGFVNYQRWGNPLAFTGDMDSYLLARPEWSALLARYGSFNIVRLGYGLAYYFVPVWASRTPDGTLLWSAFQHRTICSVELPPASFLLSDPLIVGLAVFALVQLVANREALNRAIAVPVLAGLFVPIGLMLTFNSMAFRYRLEFYPFFDLCAFLGFAVLVSRPKTPLLIPSAAAAILGIVASHGLWILYVLGRFGDASERLAGMGVISFYGSMFH